MHSIIILIGHSWITIQLYLKINTKIFKYAKCSDITKQKKTFLDLILFLITKKVR